MTLGSKEKIFLLRMFFPYELVLLYELRRKSFCCFINNISQISSPPELLVNPLPSTPPQTSKTTCGSLTNSS